MRTRQWLFALIIVTLSSVLTLAVGEAIVRFFDLGPQVYALRSDKFRLSSDDQLGYELAPGAPDGDNGSDLISSQGLRDREYTEIEPSGVYRIAVIGDSVAFGAGVQQREAMPKVLERLLNRPGLDRKYEVMNFAVEGYNSAQIARRMVTTVSRFNPDLVIYLYCLNDPDSGFDDIVEALLAKLDSKEQSIVVSKLVNSGSIFHNLEIYHMVKQVISNIGLLKSNITTLKYAVYKDEIDYSANLHADQALWGNTVRDIREIASETHRIGANLVGVISPIFKKNGQIYRDNYPLGAVHAQIANAFRQVGASVLDLAPEMNHFPASTQDRAGYDMYHYTIAGHQFVARILFDFLTRPRGQTH